MIAYQKAAKEFFDTATIGLPVIVHSEETENTPLTSYANPEEKKATPEPSCE